MMTLKFLIYQQEYDDWYDQHYEYSEGYVKDLASQEYWDKRCWQSYLKEGPDCLEFRRQKYIIEGDTPEQAIRKKKK